MDVRGQTKDALRDGQRPRALVLLRRGKRLGKTLARLETVLENLETVLGQIEDARTNEQVSCKLNIKNFIHTESFVI